jgi:hypothetical protein
MRKSKLETRFGIGEWYGHSFSSMSPEMRRRYAELQFDTEAPASARYKVTGGAQMGL